ncbi:hypothetical protein BLOT_000561 [Blomia tropicalis]|nr:hypothetical protein BLOT_000561 [Blomia tropicalis]
MLNSTTIEDDEDEDKEEEENEEWAMPTLRSRKGDALRLVMPFGNSRGGGRGPKCDSVGRSCDDQ